ncbi:hypothetical protein Enr13x_12500 [Stieleria neptunia]|uniref:Uncharacterized protein n=1 Tax=Stieleria neptunia TaxID=2527979 RepID=A0A518HKP0_9BACT|nr:hypothetical protein [Stieleria neptunia]QDV41411.1 hypothetical protein Enr13x_12500 [Stieleria neptunia]
MSELTKVAQAAVKCFQLLPIVRQKSRISLGDLFEQSDLPRIASLRLLELKTVVACADEIADCLTDDLAYPMRAAVVADASQKRPEKLPAEFTCCLESAVPTVNLMLWRFYESVSDSPESKNGLACLLLEPVAKDIEEASTKVAAGTVQLAAVILESLVSAIDATGYSDDDFRLFAGAVQRECAAFDAVAPTLALPERPAKNSSRKRYDWNKVYAEALVIIQNEPEALGMDCAKWARKLGVKRTTFGESPAWKQIQGLQLAHRM